MTYYVLRRDEDGAFVAPSGSRSSYTSALQKAQRFTTREAANAQACGNEYALAVDEAFTHPPVSRRHG
jgi:hypothetical protein